MWNLVEREVSHQDFHIKMVQKIGFFKSMKYQQGCSIKAPITMSAEYFETPGRDLEKDVAAEFCQDDKVTSSFYLRKGWDFYSWYLHYKNINMPN